MTAARRHTGGVSGLWLEGGVHGPSHDIARGPDGHDVGGGVVLNVEAAQVVGCEGVLGRWGDAYACDASIGIACPNSNLGGFGAGRDDVVGYQAGEVGKQDGLAGCDDSHVYSCER